MYINLDKKEWASFRKAVRDIMFDFCRKPFSSGFRYKPIMLPEGKGFREWENFSGRLSYVTLSDENTVSINLYNMSAGKGRPVVVSPVSNRIEKRNGEFTYDPETERMYISENLPKFRSVNEVIGFVYDRVNHRNNVMELHDHFDERLYDFLNKDKPFEVGMFPKVLELSDGNGNSYFFFDRRHTDIESKLLAKGEYNLFDMDPDKYCDIVTKVYQDAYGSVEGTVPYVRDLYFNGKGFFTQGELAEKVSQKYEFSASVNREDCMKLKVQESALACMVSEMNRSAIRTALLGEPPLLAESEVVPENFCPKNAVLVSYAPGGEVRYWNDIPFSLEVVRYNKKGERLMDGGYLANRNALDIANEAATKLFSKDNLEAIRKDYSMFISRDRTIKM